eukprot:Tamp_24638.p1 GENE.Tamp_24638~~Tamp_24638.p1  ORF type:complete len:231 (+),score=17.92 Tamp_24638:89-781(+)
MPTCGGMYDESARSLVRSERPRKNSSTSSINMQHCASLMTALEASAHEQSRSEDRLHQLLSKLPKDLPTLRESWHSIKYGTDEDVCYDDAVKPSSEWANNMFVQKKSSDAAGYAKTAKTVKGQKERRPLHPVSLQQLVVQSRENGGRHDTSRTKSSTASASSEDSSIPSRPSTSRSNRAARKAYRDRLDIYSNIQHPTDSERRQRHVSFHLAPSTTGSSHPSALLMQVTN